MNQPALVVDGVSRTFGRRDRKVHALRGVSFAVAEGEVIGLLGANGAGKTTLTKIAATLLLPSSGVMRVHGADVVRHAAAARRMTSVVFGGDRGLYPRISGRDNLRFFAVLGGVSRRELAGRADEALAEAGLGDVAGRLVETYSRGMRQRLHLAIGMFTRPRLLLLDEPTVGLDPIEAQRLREVIAKLRNDGVAVLLTSHYLLDVERLADRVVLLGDGTVTGDMPVSRFVGIAGYVSTVTVRAHGTPPALPPAAAADSGMTIDTLRVEGDVCIARLRIKDWRAESFSAVSRLIGTVFGGMEILDVQVEPLRLDEAYADFHNGHVERR